MYQLFFQLTADFTDVILFLTEHHGPISACTSHVNRSTDVAISRARNLWSSEWNKSVDS